MFWHFSLEILKIVTVFSRHKNFMDIILHDRLFLFAESVFRRQKKKCFDSAPETVDSPNYIKFLHKLCENRGEIVRQKTHKTYCPFNKTNAGQKT